MNAVVDLQPLIWQLIGLLLAFFGACGWGLSIFMKVSERRLDERFATMEKNWADHREEARQWHRVEADFLRFQAEMPMRFVMRDDYIRGQSVIEAKLDGLAGRIENSQLRAALKGGNQL